MKLSDAQSGWYVMDLTTMTAGTGTVTAYVDGNPVGSLSGGGVRQTHGQKMFQASSGAVSVEITGSGIIHGPFNVEDPASKGRILSSTWVVSSEDGSDNDYNDNVSRITWFMSAG
ncbi:MAG: fucose-binding lectin II [Myxococcota bacterium]